MTEVKDVTVYTKGKVEKITRSEAAARAKVAAKAADPPADTDGKGKGKSDR